MRIRTSYLAAALSVAFAANANATIVGSTYDFTTSVSGNTQISPLGGSTSHTDPANPGFCVGPPVACGAGAGVSGSFAFTQTAPKSGPKEVDCNNSAVSTATLHLGQRDRDGPFGTQR